MYIIFLCEHTALYTQGTIVIIIIVIIIKMLLLLLLL